MALAAVEGQQRAVEALRSALRLDSVHHAYLFGGPDGVGKELTAVGFVQALFCPQAPEEGCGACSTCLRVAGGNHPDVVWVMPEAEQIARKRAGRSDFTGAPSAFIRVEQVRALQERLAYRALEGTRKVALLLEAHQLNAQAQNALLKTLEEPPGEATLILVTASPDRLLPTIRSRCAKIPFGPLPLEVVARHLKTAHRYEPAAASLAAAMGGGSLARALAVDLEGLGARREVIQHFEEVRAEDARTVLRFAERFGASREDADACLRILGLWVRDLALVRGGGSAVAHRDLEDLLAQAAPRHPLEELLRRERLIEQAKLAISSRNASAKLQLERLMIAVTHPRYARETPMEEWIRRFEP